MLGIGPETLNPFEFFRIVVSLWGLRYAWIGLRLSEKDADTIESMPDATHQQRIAKINRRRRMRDAKRVYSTICVVLGLMAWQGVVAGFSGTGLGVETFAAFSNNAVQLIAAGALGRLAEYGISGRDQAIDTFTLANTETIQERPDDDIDR